jgi:hypothetical protein
MVELNGLAVGPYTMIAPITERPCFYHRTVAWEWKRQGKNNQWVKVAAECMHVPFFLDDNTGKVMVDPRGAELDLHRDFQQEFCDGFFTTKQSAPANVQNFLLRHGVSTRNKIKVEEFCIKPKNALFVLGTLDENPGLEVSSNPIRETEPITTGGSGTFSFSLGGSALSFMETGTSLRTSSLANLSGKGSSKDDRSEDERLLQAVLSKPAPSSAAQASQVIHLSPPAAPADAAEMTQQQKVAAALVKAGITNPTAWAAARVAPAPVVLRNDASGITQPTAASDIQSPETALSHPSQPQGFEQRPRDVLMKGTNNSTFIISWRSQRDLAQSLGWKCTLMIWGGPALTILCLYALHNMTHWF